MGPRDYLSEIRDKRVARESKMSNVGRVRNVIKNEKLMSSAKFVGRTLMEGFNNIKRSTHISVYHPGLGRY